MAVRPGGALRPAATLGAVAVDLHNSGLVDGPDRDETRRHQSTPRPAQLDPRDPRPPKVRQSGEADAEIGRGIRIPVSSPRVAGRAAFH